MRAKQLIALGALSVLSVACGTAASSTGPATVGSPTAASPAGAASPTNGSPQGSATAPVSTVAPSAQGADDDLGRAAAELDALDQQLAALAAADQQKAGS